MAALLKDKDGDPEDRDEYTAENVFWVPEQARWPALLRSSVALPESPEVASAASKAWVACACEM